MKKVILITLMLLTVCSYAVYNVGDTVLPADNISYTISGPAGNPEVGNSGTIFDMIAMPNSKPVMIFCGQTW